MFEKLLKKNSCHFFGLHEPYDWMVPDGSVKKGFDTLALIKEWF